jgi:hypothetical protein
VLWLIRYRNSFISEFIEALFNLSSVLAQYVSEDRSKDALVLLLNASLCPRKALICH